jgi:hypothetical protein
MLIAVKRTVRSTGYCGRRWRTDWRISMNKSQKSFDFGTEPKKLHRSTSLETSVESAYNVDTTKLEEMVYDTILESGKHGCIADDVLEAHPEYPYSSITARFSALVRKGYVMRYGDKRVGRSGRKQSVMRASDEQ